MCANVGVCAIWHLSLMYIPQSSEFLVVLKELTATW